MSAAGRPETRRVPGPALLAGLALLVAVLIVGALLLASRQPSALPLPARVVGPKVSPARRPGSPSARPKGKVSRPGVQNRGLAPLRKPAAVVVIAERPTAAKPLPPSDNSAPVPTATATPKPPRMPAERSSRQAHPTVPPEVAPPTQPPDDGSEADDSYSPPEPAFRVEARYPEDAAQEDVTGSVRLKLVLDRRGRVDDAVVVQSSGDDRLDAAAVEAVRRWRYRPAHRNGRAVAAVDYATIEFYRDDSAPPEP